MNKIGSSAFVYLMIGILFFILGMSLAIPLNDIIQGSNVKGVNGLNCSNPSISNQDKSVCYQVDSLVPLWTGVLFGFAGVVLTRLFGG